MRQESFVVRHINFQNFKLFTWPLQRLTANEI